MVIHQYDKRKNNKTEGARAKLKEYIEKGKELKKAADEEEKEEHQEDELIFTIEDLKELDEDEPKKEEVIKEVVKEEPKEDYKAKYDKLQKEHEELKKNPKVVMKSEKEQHAELVRSKLIAMFQPPHK